MTAEEKTEMLANLVSGREALLQAMQGLTDDLSTRRPGPGRWSVLECVEHVAIAEEYMLDHAASSKPADRPMVNTARENAIRKRGTDRSNRIEAPDVALPRGRFSRLEDARDHFVSTRSRTIEFVEGCRDELRGRIARHPLIGEVNCYELLLIMASHPHRHAKQIRETVQTLQDLH
jgi:hypothetical protein